MLLTIRAVGYFGSSPRGLGALPKFGAWAQFHVGSVAGGAAATGASDLVSCQETASAYNSVVDPLDMRHDVNRWPM